MTEQRRAVDTANGTTTKAAGPMDRLGHVLKAEGDTPVIPDIRNTDLEPYVGLRYLSKLFKLMGVILAGGDLLKISFNMPFRVIDVFSGVLLFCLISGEALARYRVRWGR